MIAPSVLGLDAAFAAADALQRALAPDQDVKAAAAARAKLEALTAPLDAEAARIKREHADVEAKLAQLNADAAALLAQQGEAEVQERAVRVLEDAAGLALAQAEQRDARFEATKQRVRNALDAGTPPEAALRPLRDLLGEMS